MNKIFFTADLHFGHTNILKHQPDRPFAQEGDYILGDLTFFKSEDARHLLEKLPGQKFLIQGKLDEHKRLSNDLRFDVGIDGELAKRAGGFIQASLSTSTQNRIIARK